MGKIDFASNSTAWGGAKVLLKKEQVNGGLEVGIYTCDVGKKLERHDHTGAAEWCYILSGEAAFDCDGEITNVGPGDYVYLPPNSNHTSYPTGNEPLVSVYIVCND